MKTKLCLLLLVLCTLLSLAACSGERYDSLYYTDHADGLTYGVRGSRGRPKQIVVKNGEEVLFTEKVKIPKEVGSLGGTYGFIVDDFNFDGHADFLITDGVNGDCISNICWLYDPSCDTYVISEELSALCNVRANQEMKAIFGFEQQSINKPGDVKRIDTSTKYVWSGGVPVPEMQLTLTYYAEQDIYCFSRSFYDPETRAFSDPDDKWLSAQTYQTYDMSFLYYFK